MTDASPATTDATVDAATAELRDSAEQGILLLLPRVLKQEPAQPVSPDAALMEDLGLTSGTTLELILELEDHLDIQVDIEEISPDDLRSVTDLAAYVAAHVVAED
ncbi:acyl carrier protein [Streptomyces sp. NPDC051976]|uniref:acyl carrier protein n=1 Tax=Streptomyces sp. NPDC051976 TaxID=3154947 RepID=UPI0034341D39